LASRFIFEFGASENIPGDVLFFQRVHWISENCLNIQIFRYLDICDNEIYALGRSTAVLERQQDLDIFLTFDLFC
jgi:hypothetical protein